MVNPTLVALMYTSRPKSIPMLEYDCGPSKADGSIGPATQSAVIRFQGDNGLVQDGIVGPATRDAIKKALDDLATNKNENGGTTDPVTTNYDLKDNGQDKSYNGYGGIEDINKYVNATYGKGWTESKSNMVLGISDFLQGSLEENANNCTLASITRIMKYYSTQGYSNIPNDEKEIYKVVREVGVKHRYDPNKTGFM